MGPPAPGEWPTVLTHGIDVATCLLGQFPSLVASSVRLPHALLHGPGSAATPAQCRGKQQETGEEQEEGEEVCPASRGGATAAAAVRFVRVRWCCSAALAAGVFVATADDVRTDITGRDTLTGLASEALTAGGRLHHAAAARAFLADPGKGSITSLLSDGALVFARFFAGTLELLVTCGSLSAFAAGSVATVSPALLAFAGGYANHAALGRAGAILAAAQILGAAARSAAAVVFSAGLALAIGHATAAVRELGALFADVGAAIIKLCALFVTVARAREALPAHVLAARGIDARSFHTGQTFRTLAAVSAAAIPAAALSLAVRLTYLALLLQIAQGTVGALATASATAIPAAVQTLANGRTALADVAHGRSRTGTVGRTGRAGLPLFTIAGVVAAVRHAECARAVDDALIDAHGVPGRFAAVGVEFANASFTQAPTAPGRFRLLTSLGGRGCRGRGNEKKCQQG